MSSRVVIWRPRWVVIFALVALAAAAILAVRHLQEPILRAAGWALVANETIAPADIIVVSLDSDWRRCASKRRTSCIAASRSELPSLWIRQAVKIMNLFAGGFLTKMRVHDRFAN